MQSSPGRPVCGVASQLLNAGTNVATVYLASRLLVPDAFGGFVLAFGAVSLALATGRGLIGSTLLAHLPSVDGAQRRALVRSALGFAGLVGLAATGALLVASAWVPALVWFAPWVPVALVHDVGRYVFLATGRRGSALLLDVVWAAAQALVLGVLTLTGSPAVGGLAAAWGLGATAGLAAFAVLVRSAAVPAGPRPWLRATRDVAGWFTAVSVLGQAELYLVLVLTATLVSPADAGGLRAVQLLVYQPPLVLCGAVLGLVTPGMAAVAGDRAALRLRWRRTALAVVPVAVAVLATALAADPLMALLFGRYTGYAPLVAPVALQAAAVTFAVPTSALLIATRRGRLDLVLHAVRTAVLLTGVVVGATVAGPYGVAWSLAVTGAGALVLMTVVAGRLHGPGPRRLPRGRIPAQRTAGARLRIAAATR